MTELVFQIDDNLASRFSNFVKEKYNGDQNAAISGALLLLFLQSTEKKVPNQKRKLGTAKGKIKIADDFDAPLDDFKEYMQRSSENVPTSAWPRIPKSGVS
jgi:hypothetical protein